MTQTTAAPPSAGKTPLWTKDFVALCLSNFFMFITFYTLMTTLPLYVSETMNGSSTEMGLAVTTFVISALFIRIFAGRWVDELGKRNMYIASAAAYLASTLLYFAADGLLSLLLLRLVHGASFGVITTTMASVAADLVPDRRKAEGLGYFALSMNLAMVLGPFLGLTLIAAASFDSLFAILTAVSVISLACGLLVKFPSAKPHAVNEAAANRPAGWRRLLEPNALPVGVSGLIVSLGYAGIIIYAPTFAAAQGYEGAGSYFFVVFAFMLVLSRPFTGRWFDTYGPHVVIYPSIALYTAGLILLSQSYHPALFLLSAALIGIGFGTLFPGYQTIAVKASPAARRGVATSTYLMMFDLGFVVGSFLLGAIASGMGVAAMFLFSAVIIAANAAVYYSLNHRRNSAAATDIP